MSTILSNVKAFFDAIFSVDSASPGIASQLVTWLTTSGHELALIPLYMWILVSLVGTVRRFIPGN